MPKSFSKVFVTMVILIAFIGQASAYSFMPSFELEPEHSSLAQTNAPANGAFYTDSETPDDCCEVDCCESDCICPANACAAFVFVSNIGYLQPMMRFSDSIMNSHLNMPNNIVESLYRPPIFTS